MAGPDPNDIRNLNRSMEELNSNMGDFVSALTDASGLTKAINAGFGNTKKAVENINKAIKKEQERLSEIHRVEKIRHKDNKKLSQEEASLKKKYHKKNLGALSEERTESISKLKEETRNIAARSRTIKKWSKEDSNTKIKLLEKEQKAVKTTTGKSDYWKKWRKRRRKESDFEDVRTKRQDVKKGFHTAKIAGELSDVGGTLAAPFKNKSLNPLKWLETGLGTKEKLAGHKEQLDQWTKSITFWQNRPGGFKGRGGLGKTRKEKKEGTESDLSSALKTTGRTGKSKKVKEGLEDLIAKDSKVVGKTIKSGKLGDAAVGLISNAVKGSNVGKKGKATLAGAAAKSAGEFGKAAKGLGFLTTVVKGLSAALGLLMKANWIFALIAAMAAVGTAIVNLDKFFKGLNKTFLEMTGPTLGRGDVVKNMGEFNDAIFSLNRNLKLGIKAEDIQGMFKAMAGEGLAPQVMARRAGGYDKVIEMVRKTNLDLGVSFEEAGKMIAEQMRDLKDSFDGSRKSFQVLGYQAQKAGINTNKFYGAVESTINSLSFLGNYTKQASASLVNFMDNANLSFKDAAKASEEYMTAFNKMDWKQLQVAFAIAGNKLIETMNKASIRMIEKPLKDYETDLEKVTEQISKTKDDPEALKGLYAQQKELNKNIDYYSSRQYGFSKALEDFQRTKMVGALTQYRDLLAGSLGEAMSAIEESTGVGTENFTAMMEVMKKGLGISDNLVLQMNQMRQGFELNFQGLEDVYEKGLGNVLKGDAQGNNKVTDSLIKLVEQGKMYKDDAGMLEKIRISFNEVLGNSKDANEMSKYMIKLVSAGDVGSDELISILKGMKKGDIRILKQAIKDRKLQYELGDNASTTGKKAEEGVNQLSQQNKKIIGATTSIEDYMQITKDSVKYFAASKMAEGTAEMVKLIGHIGEDVSIIASDKKQNREADFAKLEKVDYGVYGGLRKTPMTLKDMFLEKQKLSDEYNKTRKDISSPDVYVVDKALKKRKKILEDIDTVTGAMDKTKKQMAETKITGGTVGETAVDDLLNKYKEEYEESLEKKGIKNEPGMNRSDKAKAEATDFIEKTTKEGAEAHKEQELKRDFKTIKGGLAMLDKGDIAFKPAAGIGGGGGTLMQEAMEKMGLFEAPVTKKNISSPVTYEINLGGIQVHGDIENPLIVKQAGQKITDMIEQVIIKREREKALRKG